MEMKAECWTTARPGLLVSLIVANNMASARSQNCSTMNIKSFITMVVKTVSLLRASINFARSATFEISREDRLSEHGRTLLRMNLSGT
jgi:hypothetical protein